MGNWWPTQGEGYLLLVFASVFIGGTSVYGGSGTVWGTVIGSIMMGTIEAGIVSSGWSGFWTRFVDGLVLLLSVSFYALVSKRKRGKRRERVGTLGIFIEMSRARRIHRGALVLMCCFAFYFTFRTDIFISARRA